MNSNKTNTESIGNVYPVTEHPESSNSLKGKPLIPGYQSHFTIGLIFDSFFLS